MQPLTQIIVRLLDSMPLLCYRKIYQTLYSIYGKDLMSFLILF